MADLRRRQRASSAATSHTERNADMLYTYFLIPNSPRHIAGNQIVHLAERADDGTYAGMIQKAIDAGKVTEPGEYRIISLNTVSKVSEVTGLYVVEPPQTPSLTVRGPI